MAQTEQILDHLKTVGPLTQIEALNRFGCFRLAARIGELRERGIAIRTEQHRLTKGGSCARYVLEEQA